VSRQVMWLPAEVALIQPSWLVVGGVVIAACLAVARLAYRPARASRSAASWHGGRRPRHEFHEPHRAHVKAVRGLMT
jgi:hypothetical protein